MIPSRNHFVSQCRDRRLVLLCMIFAALFLGACGKKGPLYLPQDAAAENPGAAAVSPTPALSAKN